MSIENSDGSDGLMVPIIPVMYMRRIFFTNHFQYKRLMINSNNFETNYTNKVNSIKIYSASWYRYDVLTSWTLLKLSNRTIVTCGKCKLKRKQKVPSFKVIFKISATSYRAETQVRGHFSKWAQYNKAKH